MRSDPHPTRLSVWTRRLALFAVALVIFAAVFHRIFGMPTALALNLFGLSFALAVVTLVMAAAAFFNIWQRGTTGVANILTGVVLAITILLWPLSILPSIRALPQLNDISTDTENPPNFVALKALRPKGANGTAYPGVKSAKLQSQFYRELQPLVISRPPQEVFELAGQALRRLHMKTVGEMPVGAKGRTWGMIEAYDRTLVLGFYDDVVVRISALGRGSRVDVRSASRFGRHDLGRNAMRVRRVLNEIVAQAEASVPSLRSISARRSRQSARAVRLKQPPRAGRSSGRNSRPYRPAKRGRARRQQSSSPRR